MTSSQEAKALADEIERRLQKGYLPVSIIECPLIITALRQMASKDEVIEECARVCDAVDVRLRSEARGASPDQPKMRSLYRKATGAKECSVRIRALKSGSTKGEGKCQ